MEKIPAHFDNIFIVKESPCDHHGIAINVMEGWI